MSERHLIAILAALVRVRQPELEVEVAILQAIALARGGMGESELVDALEVICWGRGLTPAYVLFDVDEVLADARRSSKGVESPTSRLVCPRGQSTGRQPAVMLAEAVPEDWEEDVLTLACMWRRLPWRVI
jgi:hypothetical protein